MAKTKTIHKSYGSLWGSFKMRIQNGVSDRYMQAICNPVVHKKSASLPNGKLSRSVAAIGRDVRGRAAAESGTRTAEKNLRLIFGGKEAALAASRYIEGHALTLR